ncbi:MAG TPA: c-type cytochrome [Chloroflexota bacterium]|nr:c-type cytochrome [Chloroflexota bacterium]
MRGLKLAAVAVLVLAGCGPGEAGNGVRENQLPPQIAAENYARFAPTPSAQAVPHPLPTQLTPTPNVPGDPNAGRTLFMDKGCGGCHTLTRLPGATGVAGPRLDNTVVRGTIAGGSIPLSPSNMAQWIFDPSSLKPGTTMPKPGVTQAEARDIAAFLYSLPENP